MKKQLMTLALAAMVAAPAFAQQKAEKPAYKTVFAKDKASAHWFIEVGDAASISLAGHNRYVKFGDRISLLNPNVSVGRWINPSFGMRVQLQGGKLFDFARPNGLWQDVQVERYLRHDAVYGLGSLDFMWDMTNYFMPYRENRVFHFIPFLGLGAGYKHSVKAAGIKDDSHRWSPTAEAGLQLKFRLCSLVDLNLEGKVTAADLKLPSSTFSNKNGGASYIAQAGASLTFHLGQKAFTPIQENDPNLIADLNGQINALRAENAELAKRPVNCPDVEMPVADSKVVGNVIYFRLNSAVVDRNQMINVYNIAEYAKNNTETITLVGYADRKTGTPSYNYKLSKRRAEAVADILVKKYGISRDRLKIDWKGDTVQPYAENVWNRVVLMSAE